MFVGLIHLSASADEITRSLIPEGCGPTPIHAGSTSVRVVVLRNRAERVAFIYGMPVDANGKVELL